MDISSLLLSLFSPSLFAVKNPVICLNCSELLEIRNSIELGEDIFMMVREILPNGITFPQVNSIHYLCDGDLALKSVSVYVLVFIGLIALYIILDIPS